MQILSKCMNKKNNPENSTTTKESKYTTWSCSVLAQHAFHNRKNKYDHYRGKDCITKFCYNKLFIKKKKWHH